MIYKNKMMNQDKLNYNLHHSKVFQIKEINQNKEYKH